MRPARTPRSGEPIAQREAIRRRVTRLRAQRAHVVSARSRAPAARRTARGGYRMLHDRRLGIPGLRGRPNDRAGHGRACRTVATGPAICLGRYRAGPVRLFGADPVDLRAGRNSPGPHHISADQRRRPGAHVPRSGQAIWCSRRRVTCSWRSATTSLSRRPYSGADVRISRLGTGVQIRRPTA